MVLIYEDYVKPIRNDLETWSAVVQPLPSLQKIRGTPKNGKGELFREAVQSKWYETKSLKRRFQITQRLQIGCIAFTLSKSSS